MNDWLTPWQVQDKIIALVAEARRRHGIPHKCSGRVACERLGLQLNTGPIPSGADGLYVNGQVVVNERVTWDSRIEFTIFHEIMHHLLDEDGELIEYFTRTLRNKPQDFDAAIERCCHQGAAEFLMPRDDVRAIIAANGFSAGIVERIAAEHGASLVAAAIQAAFCAPIDCYVVLCCHGRVPRSQPPRDGLYIDYAAAPWRRMYPLARFTVVPPDHALYQAWQNHGTVTTDWSRVPFRSGKSIPCRCEARYLKGRVIGVLGFEDVVPSDQLALFPGL